MYGITFPDKKQLAEHLERLAEAKKRDHRVVGTQMELFMFDKLSPGSCFFMPNGACIYNALVEVRTSHQGAEVIPGRWFAQRVIRPYKRLQRLSIKLVDRFVKADKLPLITCRLLTQFIREKYWEYEYDEVVTPNMYNLDLWKTSGHADHYKVRRCCMLALFTLVYVARRLPVAAMAEQAFTCVLCVESL